jgi:hypothetical protein
MKGFLTATLITASLLFCYTLRKPKTSKTQASVAETVTGPAVKKRYQVSVPQLAPSKITSVKPPEKKPPLLNRASTNLAEFSSLTPSKEMTSSLSAQVPSVKPRENAKSYADEDEKLLKQLILKAQQTGSSKVAYVGELPELYAFDPRFFVKTVNAQGQPALELRAVESMEQNKLVQREAYAVPSVGAIDYNNLSHAIMKATDDGAMLVNLTSAGVDRSRLDDSIRYARNRGVVVVTVRPPVAPK